MLMFEVEMVVNWKRRKVQEKANNQIY